MCETQDVMPKKLRVSQRDKQKCARCDQKGRYIIRNLTFCRECYLQSIYQRFSKGLFTPLRTAEQQRDARRKMNFRPSTQAGPAVIALSGGAGSASMLDMLMDGFIGVGDGKRADKTKGERDVLWDSAVVVHVDFSAVTGVSRVDAVKAMAGGLECQIIDAAEAFKGDLAVDLRSGDMPFTQSDSSLLSILSLPAASRPAIIEHVLLSLLHRAAAATSASHILLGETSTREAQRIISGTAIGRGWALPLELSSLYERDGVARVKPLKEISVKEAAIYCHLKGISTFNERRWAVGKGKAPSIEALTEQFIAGLSVTHPATVSTINRTGNKLVFGGEDVGACPLCQMPVDPSARDWKSRTALTSLTGEADRGEGLADLLCYACLTTLTPSKQASIVGLPSWVAERSLRRVEEGELHSQIEQFLL